MALSDAQVRNRCLLHCGSRQCRYLESDPMSYNKFYCLKQLASRKRDADKEVRAHLADCKKHNASPHSHWKPIGDGGNCSGYPYAKSVKQGYDIAKKK